MSEEAIQQKLTLAGLASCVAKVFAHLIVTMGVETATSALLGAVRAAAQLVRGAFQAARVELDLCNGLLSPIVGTAMTFENILRGPSVVFDQYITPAMRKECPVLSSRLGILDKTANPLREKLRFYQQLSVELTKYTVELQKKVRELELSVNFFEEVETALNQVLTQIQRGEL